MKITSKESLDQFYHTDKKIDAAGVEHFLSHTSLKRVEADYLATLITNNRPVHTLEVGLALGASAIGIASAKAEAGISEKHIALDPYQQKHGRNVGINEIESLHLTDFFTHYSVFSEDYLTQCYRNNEKFDFIFIDGSHTIGQAVTDAFLSDKVLNDNGIIAIHDAAIFSTAASIKYLVKERNYTLLGKSRFNILRILKHLPALGFWYSLNVMPKLNKSIIALRKG